MRYRTLLWLLPVLITANPVDKAPEIRKFIELNRDIRTEVLVVHSVERYAGEMKEHKADISLMREPFSIYYRRYFPQEGLELVWRSDRDSAVRVHTNGFPNLKLDLDPQSKYIRRNTRHTLQEVGMNYIARTLERFLIDENRTPDITRLADTVIDGNSCSNFRLHTPDFAYFPYTVRPGDSSADLANRYGINEYMILEKNPELGEYGVLPKGEEIRIPNAYAKTLQLCIDKGTGFPLYLRSADEEGVFEVIRLSDIRVNVELNDSNFQLD